VPTLSDRSGFENAMMSHSRWRIRDGARLAPLLVVLALASGCGGPPQVAAENRAIITSLATAVSARNNDWLESNARLIEKRRTEGRLSDAEYGTFTVVVAKARAGDWKAAQQDVYALREAQEPTSEDLQNVAQRKRAPEHNVPKNVVKIPRRGRSPR
jgi:hypothetical protein